MELPAGTLAPFQQQRLQSAVQFALRELLIAQPDNPVQFVAQRLREYANGRATETDAEAWRGLADDALPPDGGHRRRPHVFGAAPPIDASWVPPLVQKSEDQAGFVMEAMSAHPILRHHSLDQRCLFVDAAEEAFFEAGDVLCEAGQAATRCLIVESGSVQQGDQTWHRGAVFGVEGLLYPCAYRHTVVACSETTCWTLEPSTYRRILRETRVDEPEVVPAAAADTD